MGVLEFSGSLRHADGQQHPHDIISFDIPEDAHNGINNHLLQFQQEPCNTPRLKRKQLKSGSGTCYDFRDYGIDARRCGSKYQRRKQNFLDLLLMVDDDDLSHESTWFDNRMTAFAALFMDEKKMNIWEGFMNLPEDRQSEYLEDLQEKNFTNAPGNEEVDTLAEEEMKFLLIDKKIRDMLQSKKLVHEGLLKYYEDDMLSCLNEWFPSVVIMNLSDKYDRMLVYALCQYMCLTWNSAKLKDSTIIEIDLGCVPLITSGVTLTEYLKKKTKH